MPVLARADHPLAMKKARAAEFIRAVSATGDVPKALEQAGGSRQLAEVLVRARPSDPTQVLLRLLPILSETAVLARSMKAAATYPLALVASFAVAAWAIFTISMPALAMLTWMRSREPSPSALIELAICAGCCGLLLVIAALTSRGGRIPGLTVGIRVLDRARVLETAAALVEGQVLLPIAISAAAQWAGPPIRAAGDAVARGLDTGTTPVGAGALLDPEGAAILCASAQRGVAGPVLRALAEQALIEARCRIPREIRRVQAATLVLAGFALLALAVGWYHTYLHSAIG